MTTTRPNHPYWQPRLKALGDVVAGLDDLAQAIPLIIQTPLGSVPLDPDFGTDLYPWLDRPAAQATPNIIRSIFKAIKRNEPRVILDSVKVIPGDTAPTPSRLRLSIHWHPADTWLALEAKTTEVIL